MIFGGLCCNCDSDVKDDTDIYPRTVSLEEAQDILGTDIPIPCYFPEGFMIKEYLIEEGLINNGKINYPVMLLINNSINGEEITGAIELEIIWYEKGGIPIKIIDDRVKINDSYGLLQSKDDTNTILWNWQPHPDKPEMFEFMISANEGIPIEELIEIAESVRH